MIPKIIHQTWKDRSVPERFVAMQNTWIDNNPGWEHRLWTDEDLDRLAHDHYPDFYDLYLTYPTGVQRSDAGRYLVLHKYGGVYADMDTTCEMAFDFLTEDSRIIFAEEPREQSTHIIKPRNLDFLVTNAVMASPKKHPFWNTVISNMKACVHAKDKDVLDSTGPLLLTGCVQTYPNQNEIALHSCHLFSSLTVNQTVSGDPVYGDYSPRRASTHYWAGSWIQNQKKSILRDLRGMLRYWHYRFSTLSFPDDSILLNTVVRQKIEQVPIVDPNNWNQNIAILIPLRDAEKYLNRCLELIGNLDFPKKQIKLVFCEGDSTDKTAQLLDDHIEEIKSKYRDIISLKLDVGSKLHLNKRWLPRYQMERRSGLARVRNYLVECGLDDNDDWALWIDVDVCDYPSDILKTLLMCKKHIITPNCVLEVNGRSYDMNNFLDVGIKKNSEYFKYVIGGIFQPPAKYNFRRHLHDLKYLNQTPLTGVGGTMLLVHASLHRAGVIFPQTPYNDLVETEGFGQLACDIGLTPYGLPNQEIFHSKT